MPSCSAPQTQLVTDDGPSYQNLPGVRHDAITLGPMAAHIALPCGHSCISPPPLTKCGQRFRVKMNMVVILLFVAHEKS
jgi:hypothetical protein